MEDSILQVSTNWSHVGGCTPLQLVHPRAADTELFTRPQLSELVDENKSILLSQEKCSENCELSIKLYSSYKVQSVSFVCNVAKVEIFQGPIKEYLQTVYGVIVDEQDDIFKSYRYDVEIKTYDITTLALRLLTYSSEVCIFGVILHIVPNSKDVKTLLPNTSFPNVENVFYNLTEQRTKPDKFAKFLELVSKKNLNSLPLDQHRKQEVNIEECTGTTVPKVNDDMLNGLKLYIDDRLQEMELRLSKYMTDMEERQNQKFEMILNILDKINK